MSALWNLYCSPINVFAVWFWGCDQLDQYIDIQYETIRSVL